MSVKITNTQSVTVLRLPRSVFADLNHFAALENIRLQVIARDLIALVVKCPGMMPDMVGRGLQMPRSKDDARLQIPNVHRGTVQAFYALAGKQAQPALAGLFDWLAEDPERAKTLCGWGRE